jgi:8-oxo-dGTP pyrophosphatase MutT (NUDIX family)
MANGDTFQPDITVAALVLRDGRFLTVEEDVRGARVLNQPAGHVEPGESLLGAVVRETLEETGWNVRPTGFVGVYQWTDRGTEAEGERTYLRFVFVAEPLDHHAERTLDAGIVRTLWLTPGELRDGGMPLRTPLVLAAVDHFLAGQRLPLSAVCAL